MESYRTKIIYDGFLVGYRNYENNRFAGYTWIDENYKLYEMYIARRKLC